VNNKSTTEGSRVAVKKSTFPAIMQHTKSYFPFSPGCGKTGRWRRYEHTSNLEYD